MSAPVSTAPPAPPRMIFESPWRDERPPMQSPDDEMTLTEHLAELRMRIIRSALAVSVGFIIVIAFYDPSSSS